MRTCKERGIATVAVYSEADRTALHVAQADEAVEIGPAPAAQSYLDIEKVIAAAKQTGADAIHPGYGFLSERSAFVQACEQAGIIFVGPPASAMDTMGDKVRARQAMQAAGVPVVPGADNLNSAEEAVAASEHVGFPIMVKASAGGGGKGMRLVHHKEELKPAFEAAQREALAAFGDGRIFIERAVMAARHVEIQIMADAHGHVVHLGERDCSVQRRHQKVIEESPCPSAQMNPEVRAAMGDVAVRAAKAVDYRGAGTVEFLFEETDQGAQFFFLEMNTRLQVEHPVTEAVCGRDLVWDQIRVAQGEPLGYTQEDVVLRGHALECRIYAEDPINMLPRPGKVFKVRWPEGGGVRIDGAVADGTEVSSHYDPMIAKLCTWGSDRKAAIARMRRALDEIVLLGTQTNIALHQRILAEPDFAEGVKVTTRYLEHHPNLMDGASEMPVELSALIAAAAATEASARRVGPAAGRSPTHASPLSAWQRSTRWRA